MRPECITAVIKAVGRKLTKPEIDGIEERIVRHMRNLARTDPAAWTGKSNADRLREAAAGAAQELVGEAQLKKERLALTVLAHDRVQTHLTEQKVRGTDNLDALDRVLAFHADGKSNFISVESQANAVRDDALRQILGMLEASDPKWFGLFENAEGVRAIIKEIFGEASGVAEAKAGAQQWHDITTKLRERFNRAGGDVGTLDDWGLPHHHSQLEVAKAGRDQWVNDILPLVDRAHYFNPDGTRMNDAQLTDFLNNAWTTIATGGANKVEPGQFRGSGARANRGSASRQIHFKDADSYMAYQEKYGERSLYEVLTNHIDSIAKDIAMVETLGPNPDHTFRFFKDQAVRDGKLADPVKSGKFDERAIKSENLYNIVAGKTQPVASEWLAKSFDTLRNWLVAARLGSSVITSFSDDATLHLTGKLNNLPAMQLLANELAALNKLNKTEERLANRAGLGLRTLVSSLNRFGQTGLRSGFSKRLANTVLRASGLNAMTEARRRAFGVTMMSAMGSVAKEHGSLKDLDPVDHRILLSKGIKEQDFQVWKKAQLEDWGDGNNTMLTPESIYRVPDADIDAIIAPDQAKIRAKAQQDIAGLQGKNAQDAQWLAKRSTDISQWLTTQQAKLSQALQDKGAKIDAKATERVQSIAARVSKLRETLDLAQGAWMTPADANTPGIDSNQAVGFYGKSSLRALGKQEGAAAAALKRLESEADAILRDANSLKTGQRNEGLEKLFDEFNARRADLAEFAKRAADRTARRDLVAQRITSQVDPALEAARLRAREQAATKLLASILEETDVAVIEPGARERAITGAGLQRGTWKGELARSFFLFKSFPLAMLARHWARGMSLPNAGGRAAYLATLIATTTVAGVASLQVNEVLSGRDPRNLNPFEKGGTRNWIQAMLKGGSLGIYGDFLFSNSTQYGQSPVASAMGPVIGIAEDLFNLSQGNLLELAQGKKTNFGAEVTKFVRSNLPGASLWYTKAAMDHLIFHQLQEYFSPGYLATMRSRAQREFGQKYYWEPGEVLPDRAPDVGAMIGE